MFSSELLNLTVSVGNVNPHFMQFKIMPETATPSVDFTLIKIGLNA